MNLNALKVKSFTTLSKKQIKNVMGGKANTDTVTVIQPTGRYC